jgi:hypothetical protein
MKNALSQSAALLAGILAGAGALSAAQPATTYQWQFLSGANPAAPEAAPAGAGAAQATITVGPLGTGWFAAATNICGDAAGVWDLGRNGVITLSRPAGLADPAQDQILTVKVTQYQGGPYDEFADMAVPNATLLGATTIASTATAGGQMVVGQTQWRVSAGAPVTTVVITGAYDGSLVDAVEISAAAAPQLPTLSLQRVGADQIQITWSGGPADLALESTTDLASPNGWTPVQAQVQVAGAVSSVTLPRADAARFYRLTLP